MRLAQECNRNLSLRINTSIIQQYLINQVNVSAITIYPRLIGTRLIGTRPTETRLIGTLKIDRVQLERVSLACNQCCPPAKSEMYSSSSPRYSVIYRFLPVFGTVDTGKGWQLGIARGTLARSVHVQLGASTHVIR